MIASTINHRQSTNNKEGKKGLATSGLHKCGFTTFGLHERGFTMIELLIVIAIIGILATFVTVNLQGAQKRARDSQRQSDLNQYRIALTSYASDNKGFYPHAIGASCNQSVIFANPGFLVPKYMSGVIFDPKESGVDCSAWTCAGRICTYFYFPDSVDPSVPATSYVLMGNFETDGFWEICSNGKAGKVTSATCPGANQGSCVDSVCDLP